MSSQDLHEVVFLWPRIGPNTVTVAGTFEQQQWSESQALKLTKTQNGFEGRIRIPWDTKIKYKFIVDGEWMVREDQPAEMDPGGYINNVYFSPKPPPPVVRENGVIEESGEAAVNGTTDKIEPPLAVQDAAPVVVKATEGDATQPPIELDARPNSGANSNDVHPIPDDVIVDSSNDIVKNEPASDEAAPQSSFASVVPITIVPVNASENNTLPTLPSLSSDKIPELTPASTPALPTDQVPPASNLTAALSTAPEGVKVEVLSELSTHEPVVPAVTEETSPATGELGSTLVENTSAESRPVIFGTPVAGENGIDHLTSPKPTESVVEAKTPVEDLPEKKVSIQESMTTEAVTSPSHVKAFKDSSQPAPVAAVPEHSKEGESVTTPPTTFQPVEPNTNRTTANSSVNKGASTDSTSSSSAAPTKDPKDSPSTPVPSTPSTPVKSRHRFPRQSSESPSSYKMDTASSRKKKTSIFGKIKKIFYHEHENAKA